MNLGVLGRLIRRTDAGKLFNLSGASFLVQTLGIALLGLFDRNIDKDFDKRQWGIDVFGVGVEVPGELSVGFVGGDEGGEGDGGAVREEFGDLVAACQYRPTPPIVNLVVRIFTSAMRRMFSSRSLGEKPKSLFKPKRTLSPSRR